MRSGDVDVASRRALLIRRRAPQPFQRHAFAAGGAADRNARMDVQVADRDRRFESCRQPHRARLFVFVDHGELVVADPRGERCG